MFVLTHAHGDCAEADLAEVVADKHGVEPCVGGAEPGVRGANEDLPDIPVDAPYQSHGALKRRRRRRRIRKDTRMEVM